jgi:hypothetical protein
MDWTPPPAKYSTQEKATRFGKLMSPSLEEQLQLEALGAIESDNNPAAKHKLVTDPDSIHYNTAAIGEHGVMPMSALQTLKEAKVKDTVGPEMENLNRFTVNTDMANNTALQQELALNYLRKIKGKTDNEDLVAPLWKKGANKKNIKFNTNDIQRGTKYNEAKLEAIKKMFSK